VNIFSMRSATRLGAVLVAAGALATAGCSSSSSTPSASSSSTAGAPAASGPSVKQLVFGSSIKHLSKSSGKKESLSKPDDLATLGGNLFVSFQNGVGPQGEPSTTGNTESTIVEFTPAGSVVNQWDVKGKVDGLGADAGQIIATANEDANSSLYAITPSSATAVHYTYNEKLPHQGGTDAVLDYNGKLLIVASAPGTAGKAPANAPAVYDVTLNSGSKVASVAPFFAVNAQATAVNGSSAGKKTTLALADADSTEAVPASSPEFGGDFMLDGQGDQQLVFTKDGSNLQVLALPHSIDDSAFVTPATGTLYASDSTANTIDAIKGLTPGVAYSALTPCNENSAPSNCPAPGFDPNSLAQLNLKTGALSPVPGTIAVNPGAMIFLP
jgi:hypothetical protein